MKELTEMERSFMQAIFDFSLEIKTFGEFDQKRVNHIEAMAVQLLEAHKSHASISKNFLANLYAYAFGIENEAPYSPRKELILTHAKKMKYYFGLLLSQKVPSDIRYGSSSNG